MKPSPTTIRWWREPLLHFAVLGALLFVAERYTLGRNDPRTITVTRDAIAGFRQDHLRRTAKTPTADEEAALVERYVDEEVRYREALALGLDRGDVIVRRRMLQKMEFLTEDIEPVAEPSDAQLQAYLETRQAHYAQPERISFTHVFVSTERQGARARDLAAALLVELEAGANPAMLGEPFLRGRELSSKSQQDLAAIFGPDFATRATQLSDHVWSGPVASTYGFHLVRITARAPAHIPELPEIREELRRDWRAQRRSELNRQSLARLRERYDIRIER